MSQHRFLSKAALFGFTLAAGLSAAAAAGPIDEQKIENIMKAVTPSVVKVEARNGVRKIATGVVIDTEGTIVTTALISPRDEEITIRTFDGKQFKAEFKGFDTSTGLAVIEVKNKNLVPVVLGTAADVRPGVWVGAIGFSPENTPAVTQGIVSSATEDRIRLNLWVMPGSSGSPVVNSEGRLIGVLRGTYVDDQPVFFEFREQQIVGSGTVLSRAEAPSSGMALAVPADVVRSVAGDIRKDGKVLRGWIGVLVAEKDGRLEINEVEPKSPAELAKLKAGDVIVRIEGTDISSGIVFSREIRKRKPGAEVVLGILRDGAGKDVKVKLGEFTEEDGRRELETRFPGLFPPPQSGLKPGSPPDQPGKFFLWENRKYIGVTLQELTKDLAVFFGAKDGKGLLVTEFAPESPAQKAGLKIGDVILKADDRAMESVADLSDLIRNKKKEDRVKLEILRDKKTLSVEVPVAEDENRPPESEGAFQTLRQFQNIFGDRQRLAASRERMKQFAEKFENGRLLRPFFRDKGRITDAGGVFYRI
ncbi:MAG: PDZ domain-containing protein [Candidatus Aminicenantes bacterium]|nr:PDZ domain-containing protein [Candidatus Aminicenantes bacterium]